MPDVDTLPDTAERLGAGERAALADLVPDAACPYRGRHAFREEDARFFFGREVFSERLVGYMTAKPMIGVIGPSGSGKPSVVFAERELTRGWAGCMLRGVRFRFLFPGMAWGRVPL